MLRIEGAPGVVGAAGGVVGVEADGLGLEEGVGVGLGAACAGATIASEATVRPMTDRARERGGLTTSQE